MNLGIIPARYPSTRLPGKPLIDLNGQTMIERVWRGAVSAAALDEVIIATDDQRVVDAARGFGAKAVLTSPELPSGTDRCAAVVEMLEVKPEVIVNIQGDEPLLTGQVITDLVDAVRSTDADVATPVSVLSDPDELLDPSIVKVVIGRTGRAMYFSRSPVPHQRGVEVGDWLERGRSWKHIGIYAYTMKALTRHVGLPVSVIETSEALEQLRLLEDGAVFQCVETSAPFISVDTAEDADRVRAWLRAHSA